LVFDEDVLVVMFLVVVSIVGEVDEDVDPGNCVDEGFIVVLVLVIELVLIVLVLVDVVGGGQVQRLNLSPPFSALFFKFSFPSFSISLHRPLTSLG
jgi:hypothetical protein